MTEHLSHRAKARRSAVALARSERVGSRTGKEEQQNWEHVFTALHVPAAVAPSLLWSFGFRGVKNKSARSREALRDFGSPAGSLDQWQCIKMSRPEGDPTRRNSEGNEVNLGSGSCCTRWYCGQRRSIPGSRAAPGVAHRGRPATR